ncbi:hypothetical protein FKR81_08390 [Lentzea tibetensis]|uniref:Excreted virulence factor EspC, type VII ESX diderm n=1 Tax=Lentzea tibetensis TaxID=2591470 RepID=A0A563EZJ4_9PSEU|nr:type VII secretion target [Lentzea tibetensis]TWP53089.1 hypothetical protein FKR81_08390 [Lentzea tibetensis]
MFGVEPELLRNASKEFSSGSDAVREAAEMISMLRLDAGALGEVDAAAEFADALSKFVGTHSDDLRKGSEWFTDAAEGLISNADAYQRADDDNGISFSDIFNALGGGK